MTPITGNMIVEANGVYPAAEGFEFAAGSAWLSMQNPKGVTVSVEASHDGGVTWEPHHVIAPREYRKGHYERHYHLAAPTRLRVTISGFLKQFALWLVDRRITTLP